MNDTLNTIPLFNLALAFIPALVTIGILYKWSLNSISENETENDYPASSSWFVDASAFRLNL